MRRKYYGDFRDRSDMFLTNLIGEGIYWIFSKLFLLIKKQFKKNKVEEN